MAELKSKEKLLWLGLSRAAQSLSEVKEEIEKTQNTVGDFSTFQDHLQNGYDWDNDSTKESIDNFTDFRNYLEQGFGWTSTEVDRYIEKIRNNFTDDDSSGSVFDEFKSYVLNTATSYQDIVNEFGTQNVMGSEVENEDGGKAAGIKFYENAGVTQDGISVPQGSTEVFGKEIHFSQTGTVKQEDSGSSSLFTVDNFQTDDSDDVVTVGQTVTFSADITSNSSYVEYFAASLTENGDSVDTKTFNIAPGNTRTVSFTVTKNEYVCNDYKINSAGPITVCWVPAGLQV